MRPKEKKRADDIAAKLAAYEHTFGNLPGIAEPLARDVLVEQLVESLRRIDYVTVLTKRKLAKGRADPSSPIFDPLAAAVIYMRAGQFDEAFWLVFLFVHFGKHGKDKWRLVRDIYGALGGKPWTWARVSADPTAFRGWLAHSYELLTSDGISRRFGNHRKYETLDPDSPASTATVFESYVAWVGPPRTHKAFIHDVHKSVGQNPTEVFDALYRSMSAVARFGRLARFDYLTMLGKMGLAPIVPGSAYLGSATGPKRGGRLLFGGSSNAPILAKQLDDQFRQLDSVLKVGMQVLEDAICNWQKSPMKFIPFR